MRKVFTSVGVVLAVCTLTIVGVVGWDVGRSIGTRSPATVSAAGSTQANTPHFYLNIDTPEMLAKTQVGPAFLPSAFTLPADSDVTITIINFDNATPLPPSAAKYATATGVKGAVSVQALDATDPNAAKEAVRQIKSLNPETGISHTFTILKLGLNVPIPPTSKTTFTFHTTGAGTYEWRCMDPCGTGDTGWGGAMSTDGYMAGKVTFA